MLRPFISYAREDAAIAQRIYDALRRAGTDPWLDTVKLRAGEQWRRSVQSAIRSATHVVVLISKHSVNKRGFVQRELRLALDVISELPPDQLFMIPVRLDDSEPRHEQLNDYQWVDLFANYERGIQNIIASVRAASKLAVKPTVTVPVGPVVTTVPAGLQTRVPAELVQRVRDIRSTVPEHKLAVFFAHRFVGEQHAIACAEHVRAALLNNGCHLLEVSDMDGVRGPRVIFHEVSANLWAADAGVILLTKVLGVDPLGPYIPHEYGFLQGQGKPILLLVQHDLEGVVGRWTNAGGVFAPRFPSDGEAFMPENASSVYGLTKEFVDRVREARKRKSPSEA